MVTCQTPLSGFEHQSKEGAFVMTVLVDRPVRATTAEPVLESLDRVPLEVLERDLVACAAQSFALAARFLTLVAAFDRREGWAGAGLRSCAHWLSWRCGISLHAAREKVRVARALDSLPTLAAAFARGRVSYSKVRAVTRVATPSDEKRWVELAESGTATQVERIAAGYRRAMAPEDAAPSALEASDTPNEAPVGEVHRRFLPGGLVELTVVLPADEAELVTRSLVAAADSATGEQGSTQGGSVASARRAPGSLPGRLGRGLVAVAESFLAHGAAERPGGDRYVVAVHVDLDVLAEGRDPEPWETGELEHDGQRLAGHVLRRIACDAALQAVVTGEQSSPLDVGRRRRVVSSRQRRALVARDGGCVFPGCDQRRWVDAHHIVHWADGGPTDLSNLVLLCRFHHGAMHERGFSVTVVDGRVTVRDPSGDELEPAPGLGNGQWLGAAPAPADVDEPMCHWSGEPLDLTWAVGAMCDLAAAEPRPA